MNEEQATLSRFDNELKELERVIKEKKNAVAQSDLKLQDIAHNLTVLSKEKVTYQNRLEHLEKTHEWIAHDKE